LPARLIQSNDGFSLADIDEIRFFSRQIAPFQSVPTEQWEAAKTCLHRVYPSESRGASVCDAVIRVFEAANTRARYRTDFDIFVRVQSRLDRIYSGDLLNITPDGCADKNGHPVLRFSKSFMEELTHRKAAGYSPVSACVNFVVWWKKQDSVEACKIVLPEIVLRQAPALT
jgi:hypothetical protein